MINEAKMTELTQAEDMAYFRADLCIYSPESYSLEEKKEICNDMMATSKAVLDAMREDFEQLPRTPAPSSWTCSAHPESSRPNIGWALPADGRARDFHPLGVCACSAYNGRNRN